jgi:putative nucleotidyltransferase with HDIG domain
MNLDALVESACYTHSRQVSKICAMLAEKAGDPPEEAAVIEQAALYHDIGKTDIPAWILNKPGALTPEEYSVVKTHTALGYNRIMDAISVLSVAADVCRDHHERPDGAGYERRAGVELHPYTKLISTADVFDALYSKRAYKEAWDIARIREFFLAQSGTQFDAGAVQLLFSAIDNVLSLYEAGSRS